MRITLLTTGSRGDVQPFLALALGLKKTGHVVRLAAPQQFQSFIEQFGVSFLSLGGIAAEIRRREAERNQMADKGMLRFMLYRVREKQQLAAALNREAWQVCQDTDIIVGRISAFLDFSSIAERLKVPCFEVGLDPQVRTGAFPNTDFFQTPDWPGVYNGMTHVVVEQFNWHVFRAVINQFRKETLGLPPYPWTGSNAHKRSLNRPVLHAFSQVVVPRPTDWPDYAKITGYWFLDRPVDWKPPRSLTAFLHAGPPPICIGFGSMHDPSAQKTLTLINSALEQTGQRGIWMLGQDDALSIGPLSDRVYCLDHAPHDWLFPKMAAIVHHGGAGTTAASLRAGVPTITVPHLYDQPFWGRRVERLVAGPKPIPHKQMTTERLASAINAALCDPVMRARAAAVGEAIRAEDGVTRAVEIITQKIS